MPKPANKNTFFAILCFAIGIFVAAMAAGWVPVNESDADSPMWMLYLVGMSFVIVGVMIIII